MKYKVFINKFGKNKPTDPGISENSLISGDFPIAGYHAIDLPEPVTLYNGDYYSVIVHLILDDDSIYEYPTGVIANIEKYSHVSFDEGENFFAAGESIPSIWQDGTDISGGPYKASIVVITDYRESNETGALIITESIPEAFTGEDYEFTFEASGTETIEWRSGNIPEGFALSREGILTGKAEEPGEYEINLTAFNNAGTDQKVLSFIISNSDNQNSDNQESHYNLGSPNGTCNSGFSILSCVFALVLFINKKRK